MVRPNGSIMSLDYIGSPLPAVAPVLVMSAPSRGGSMRKPPSGERRKLHQSAIFILTFANLCGIRMRFAEIGIKGTAYGLRRGLETRRQATSDAAGARLRCRRIRP